MRLRLTDKGLAVVKDCLQQYGCLGLGRNGSPDAHREGWPVDVWQRRFSDARVPLYQVFRSGVLNNPITRGEIKCLGESLDSEQGLLKFAAAVFVWGAGNRPWIWPSRLDALVARNGNLGRLHVLCQKAKGTSPQDAYDWMRSRDGRVHGLGPSYGTKFLYFAGFGARCAGDRPLILDKRVAASIRVFAEGDIAGFDRTRDFAWSVSAYGEFIDLAVDAAKRLVVETDAIEYALFCLNGCSGCQVIVRASLS